MEASTIAINGVIVPEKDAKVSVFDRSFLYGDSLYEVARTYNGVPFLLDEHLDRLFESAKLCKMTLSQPKSVYKEAMLATIAHFRNSHPSRNQSECYCRIIVSRGTGKIGFSLKALQTETQYTIITQDLKPFEPAPPPKGIRLTISSRFRNHPNALSPAMKSGNYLNNLLAFLEAEEAGFDDALLCNGEGFLTEGTTFNVFYIKNQVIVTPPFSIGMLDGLTRRFLIEKLAPKLGLKVEVKNFKKDSLFSADEVFIASSIKEIYPVTQLDDQNFTAGPLTLKLREAFQKEAYAQCQI